MGGGEMGETMGREKWWSPTAKMEPSPVGGRSSLSWSPTAPVPRLAGVGSPTTWVPGLAGVGDSSSIMGDRGEGRSATREMRPLSMSSSPSSSSPMSSKKRPSPIPYRQKPLEYEPPVYCRCQPPRKAGRFISWSDRNPGRRYYSCAHSLEGGQGGCTEGQGGCNFFLWYDEELHPYLTELLKDLRDAVDSLKMENADLQAKSMESVVRNLRI